MKLKNDLKRSLHLLKVRFIVGGLLLLLAMIGLSVIWNNSIKNELAQQTTMFVRHTLTVGESRRVIEGLNGVRLTSFESITQFDREGQRVITLPPSIAPVAYHDRAFAHRLIYAEVKTSLSFDDEGKQSIGSLSFVYTRFELASYAFVAWLLLMFGFGILLSNAQKKVEKEFYREVELQNSKSVQDLIQKVRHNIRSPLAVLSAYYSANEGDQFGLREQGRRAVRRIEEILSEMEAGKVTETPRIKELTDKALIEISMLAEQIVEEKKMIAPEIEFSFKVCGGPIYSTISTMEFKTTLSNIIDNSIQSIKGTGKVSVYLEGDGHLISLEVIDSGCGIPDDILPKLTEKHFSYGKEDGSGLGLYYAQKLMDESRGSLQIDSTVGHGTAIKLFFPQNATPIWHCEEVSLDGIKKINVYDDQEIVLELFRRKFSSLNIEAQYHLVGKLVRSPRAAKNQIHFVDYDFGIGKKNGLEIIAESGIVKQSVLVTGHYDDPEIQTVCASIGCRLLPKDRISSVRITNVETVMLANTK